MGRVTCTALLLAVLISSCLCLSALCCSYHVCSDLLQSWWIWELLRGALGLQRGQDLCLYVLDVQTVFFAVIPQFPSALIVYVFPDEARQPCLSCLLIKKPSLCAKTTNVQKTTCIQSCMNLGSHTVVLATKSSIPVIPIEGELSLESCFSERQFSVEWCFSGPVPHHCICILECSWLVQTIFSSCKDWQTQSAVCPHGLISSSRAVTRQL